VHALLDPLEAEACLAVNSAVAIRDAPATWINRLTFGQRFAVPIRAWPLGLALAVRPRWAGRGLRRSRVGPGDRFCEAVRKDLGVPLTLEGPTRTIRGGPSGGCDLSHGDRRTRRERDGLALLVWHGIGA
jgi:hypothetical protein